MDKVLSAHKYQTLTFEEKIAEYDRLLQAFRRTLEDYPGSLRSIGEIIDRIKAERADLVDTLGRKK